MTLYQSHLDLKLLNRGKVRDIYELDRDHLLIVTSDRLSAFDVVLPTPIRGKGAVLTKLTRFWMNHLKVRNHLAKGYMRAEVDRMVAANPELSVDQMEVVRKAEVFPVECVVRGFITGSGWKDYQKSGEICGHKLPAVAASAPFRWNLMNLLFFALIRNDLTCFRPISILSAG